MPNFISLFVLGKFKQLLLLVLFATYFMGCTKKEDRNNDDYKMEAYIDTASNFLTGLNQKKAISYIDSVYNQTSSFSVLDLFYKYNFKVNYYLNYDKNLVKAKLNVDSAFSLLENKKESYKPQYVMAVFNKGDLLFAEGKLAAAFEYYFKGRKYAKENLDICNYANFTNRLALVRYRQGEYLKAIPFLKQSNLEYLSCAKEADFNSLFVVPQSNYNTIALCFEKSNQLDSAVFYYNKALSFIASKEDIFSFKKDYIEQAKGVIYGNLGGVYLDMGNLNEAEQYLKQSIDINLRPGYDIEDAKTAQRKLAYLFLKSNRTKEAKVLIEQLSKNDNKEINRPYSENRLLLYNLQWKYYELTKDLDKAFTYSKLYYSLRDSIFEYNQSLKKTDIDEVFKNAEQEYKLNVLSKDAQLKNAYLIASIVFLALVLIILLLVWGNLKKSKKYVAQLKELNNQVGEHNIQMQYALETLEQNQLDNEKMKKIVAHDLRNPIGGMIMGATYLIGTYPDFKGQQMLQLIEKSGNSALVLINDLLHIHSGLEKLEKSKVDFYDILDYCVNLLRLKAENKNQKIELNADHIFVKVNRDKMWRVFNNLIDNAIKFSPSGATICVKTKHENNLLTVIVEDFGVGIPTEIGEHVFDMYSPVKRTGTLGEEPFGMGLSITKRIVEAHGGNIRFENKTNQTGTIFYVELPVD